jgi:hypothetical protein
MHESLGLQTLAFATLTGAKVANRIRMLSCPKKRWFHRLKHAPRMVSADYGMEYIQG